MPQVLILLCLLTAVLFILTRRIFIKIKKEDGLKIEIHLPIFALCLTERRGARKEKKKKSARSQDYLAIFRLIGDAADTLKNCRVTIKRIELPLKGDANDFGAFTTPIIYQSFIYSLLAYIDTKVQKLTLYSGAVASSGRANSFYCDVTVEGRFFRLLYTAIFVYYRIRRDGTFG
jgi:hypothetical protein